MAFSQPLLENFDVFESFLPAITVHTQTRGGRKGGKEGDSIPGHTQASPRTRAPESGEMRGQGEREAREKLRNGSHQDEHKYDWGHCARTMQARKAGSRAGQRGLRHAYTQNRPAVSPGPRPVVCNAFLAFASLRTASRCEPVSIQRHRHLHAAAARGKPHTPAD